MDNNFIKDNRVLPEEMHGVLKTSMAKHEENHSMKVVWWILGLFLLLVLVFFVGIWTGKQVSEPQTQMTEQERSFEQNKAQQVVDDQLMYRDNLTQEQRTQKIKSFFSE